jgi:hypothetical protein
MSFEGEEIYPNDGGAGSQHRRPPLIFRMSFRPAIP